MSFIGRKVNMKLVTHETVYGKLVSGKIDDPAFFEEVKARYGDNTRVFAPGQGGTCDFDMGRTTIYINEDGVVTGVSNG